MFTKTKTFKWRIFHPKQMKIRLSRGLFVSPIKQKNHHFFIFQALYPPKYNFEVLVAIKIFSKYFFWILLLLEIFFHTLTIIFGSVLVSVSPIEVYVFWEVSVPKPPNLVQKKPAPLSCTFPELCLRMSGIP